MSIPKIIQAITLTIILMFFFSSCKTLKSTLDSVKKSVSNVDSNFGKITEDINRIQSEIVPVDTLVYNAVNGALAGVASEESKRNLDSLTANLTRNIVNHLNKALDSLDTATPAAKLITGIKDSLFAQSTSDEMSKLLGVVFDKADQELNAILTKLLDTLSSKKTENQLKSIGNAVVSGITDSLGYKLNEALQEVDFNSLRDSIIDNLLDKKFENRVGAIAKTTVKDGSEGAQGTIEFLKDNIIKVITTLAVIVFGFFLLFRYRRKDKEELISLIAGQIEEMKDEESIKKLKTNIEKKASKHKLEKKLNKLLQDKNLL